MNNLYASICSALLLLIGYGELSARGQVPPPPPFTGGNIGEWLGSGPLFDGDNPWGKDFPPGWGSSGGGVNPGSGGMGSGSGSRSGWRGTFVQDTTSNFGCSTCQRPTFVGPCIDICQCQRDWHDVTDPHTRYTQGVCAKGAPDRPEHVCGWAGGRCWYIYR